MVHCLLQEMQAYIQEVITTTLALQRQFIWKQNQSFRWELNNLHSMECLQFAT